MSSNSHQQSLTARFYAIVWVAGVVLIPFIGSFWGAATGLSPWVTYGVPFIFFLLFTMVAKRVLRRREKDQRQSIAEPQ